MSKQNEVENVDETVVVDEAITETENAETIEVVVDEMKAEVEEAKKETNGITYDEHGNAIINGKLYRSQKSVDNILGENKDVVAEKKTLEERVAIIEHEKQVAVFRADAIEKGVSVNVIEQLSKSLTLEAMSDFDLTPFVQTKEPTETVVKKAGSVIPDTDKPTETETLMEKARRQREEMY